MSAECRQAIRAVDSVSGRGTSTASTWATEMWLTVYFVNFAAEVVGAADRVQRDDFAGQRSDRS